MGLVMTSSLDALVTDSSPGAGAWATGNKSINNWHGVFPDNNGPNNSNRRDPGSNREAALPFLDNPRVENLAEFLQRTRRMSTGVVSTVAVTDSTPGAFSSHAIRLCANRYCRTDVVRRSQRHSRWRSEIFPAAGKSLYWPTFPRRASDGRNLVDEFKKAGFTFVSTATELEHAGRAEKLLGLFHGGDMSSRYDRMRAKKQAISAERKPSASFQINRHWN